MAFNQYTRQKTRTLLYLEELRVKHEARIKELEQQLAGSAEYQKEKNKCNKVLTDSNLELEGELADLKHDMAWEKPESLQKLIAARIENGNCPECGCGDIDFHVEGCTLGVIEERGAEAQEKAEQLEFEVENLEKERAQLKSTIATVDQSLHDGTAQRDRLRKQLTEANARLREWLDTTAGKDVLNVSRGPGKLRDRTAAHLKKGDTDGE